MFEVGYKRVSSWFALTLGGLCFVLIWISVSKADDLPTRLAQCIDARLTKLVSDRTIREGNPLFRYPSTGVIGVECQNPTPKPTCSEGANQDFDFPAGGSLDQPYVHDQHSTQFYISDANPPINHPDIREGSTGDEAVSASEVRFPSVNDALVNLACVSAKCYGGRTWIRGYFSGVQPYAPTINDKRHAAGECLK